jgi:hypothetical protein
MPPRVPVAAGVADEAGEITVADEPPRRRHGQDGTLPATDRDRGGTTRRSCTQVSEATPQRLKEAPGAGLLRRILHRLRR